LDLTVIVFVRNRSCDFVDRVSEVNYTIHEGTRKARNWHSSLFARPMSLSLLGLRPTPVSIRET